MKPSCSFLVLLISAAFVYDATLAGLFSMGKKKAPSKCLKPPYLGRCNRTINAWYFDPTKGWCKMFTYGPCGGGANNFRYELECLRHCQQKRHPKILCSLPPNGRQCWGSSRHWYFDTMTNTCKMFQRKLCAENANGFSSCEKCLYRCSSKKASDACVSSSVEGPSRVWMPPQQSQQAPGITNQLPNSPPYLGHPGAPIQGQGSRYPPEMGAGNGIPTFPAHQGRPEATGGWRGQPYPPQAGITYRNPSSPPYQGPYSAYGGWQGPPSPQDRGISGSPTSPANQGPSSTPGAWNGPPSPQYGGITGPSTGRSITPYRWPSQPYPPSSPVNNIKPVSPASNNGRNEVYNTSMYAALTPL
ncbi:papilin [Rhipicephalus sanguineus]|uniref:papilin n=1 Tax=Rhipicephalus sanguineus TaxID=34632 RepID=UPI001893EF58|nr:papilin [Rhipicephalus sanguineus]